MQLWIGLFEEIYREKIENAYGWENQWIINKEVFWAFRVAHDNGTAFSHWIESF